MTDETKRPTAQDIEETRTLIDAGVRSMLGASTTTPEEARAVTADWVRWRRVLDYAAACLRAEEEGERVPEVEAPEDAGDDGPDDDGCGNLNLLGKCCALNCPVHDPQPEQTPEQRVAGMTDDEVEALVTGAGVDASWSEFPACGDDRRRYYAAGYKDEAVTRDGRCWASGTQRLRVFDDTRGDTTTPEGRMECTRRLAVHLLREGVVS